jgi:hypothetical protein
MLTAALRGGAPAIAAWEAWVTGLDPAHLEDELEPDSQWLMPLLYRNLSRLGVAHPVLARCRNVYLHNWYKNNALLHALASSLRTAVSTASRPVLLKGAAMAVRYYDALGARPVETADVWTPHGATAPRPRGPAPEHVIHHDTLFAGIPDGDVVARAETVAIMGATCSVLSPADQLVHVSVLSHVWDSRSRLMWVADAVQVLRTPRFDWNVALTLAAALGATKRLATALDYLGRFDAAIRGHVDAALVGHAT